MNDKKFFISPIDGDSFWGDYEDLVENMNERIMKGLGVSQDMLSTPEGTTARQAERHGDGVGAALVALHQKGMISKKTALEVLGLTEEAPKKSVEVSVVPEYNRVLSL